MLLINLIHDSSSSPKNSEEMESLKSKLKTAAQTITQQTDQVTNLHKALKKAKDVNLVDAFSMVLTKAILVYHLSRSATERFEIPNFQRQL